MSVRIVRRVFSAVRVEAIRPVALLLMCVSVPAQEAREAPYVPPQPVRVGEFPAEVARKFTTSDGLPDNSVLSIAVTSEGRVLAGTARGAAVLDGDRWRQITDFSGPVTLMTADGAAVLATTDSALYRAEAGEVTQLAGLPTAAGQPLRVTSLAAGDPILLGTESGLFELRGGSFAAVSGLNDLLGDSQEIRQVARAADGRIAVAADAGLFLYEESAGWRRLLPHAAERSWAPRDARGVAFDDRGRLWFSEPQGAGVFDGTKWSLYTGRDGLPYNDFTRAAAGAAVVLGTREGAIRFDGKDWEYRQAPRWLPHNEVRAIAIGSDGREWYATAEGVGLIEHIPMTLARKAKFFEDEIDRYHRRTPYEFVLEVRLKNPGDKSEWTQHDSDNDGLWTAMYGAGECFAYAATKDPIAKQRATKAFEALKFLSDVTQGGSHPAPRGFPARTILPTSGPDPNATDYTPEKDRERQRRDPLWKVISPRWPTSADGKWYWKCDTSSDELDGHFFLYAAYYDLVAETEEEKQRVRDVVSAIVDHLIEHDYNLVDHDGKPTRWARFGPEEFNSDLRWAEGRGLNSMSILSYLKVAEHVTGDRKYRDAYEELVNEHGYSVNAMVPKVQWGYGTGNQSDDEMAFMNFYNLIRYEDDPERKRFYAFAFWRYWRLEEPEQNPLFNFLHAAALQSAFPDGPAGSRFGTGRVAQSALDEAVETLVRYPLDRVRWSFRNSHRIDLVLLNRYPWEESTRGHRVNGKVIPVDERSVEHWNHDPWRLDENHDGRTLTDGAAFLLPYYVGLYHGFIVE